MDESITITKDAYIYYYFFHFCELTVDSVELFLTEVPQSDCSQVLVRTGITHWPPSVTFLALDVKKDRGWMSTLYC